MTFLKELKEAGKLVGKINRRILGNKGDNIRKLCAC